MSFLSALGKAVNPVKFAIDGFTTIWHTIKGTLPPEQQHEAEMEIMRLQLQTAQVEREYEAKIESLVVEDQKSLRNLAKVEAQSEDWYVRRARPSWLWGLLAIYLTNYLLCPIIKWIDIAVSPETPAGTILREINPIEIPVELHVLVGVLVGGMMYLRTIEKTGKRVPFAKE